MLVMKKDFEAPPVCEKEILRYSGCAEEVSAVTALMKSCVSEAEDKLIYKVCWCDMDVTINDDVCEFGFFSVCSASLARALTGCKRCVVFAATVGAELDRLITGYSEVLPSKALMFQAIGTERAEALCDAFCKWYADTNSVGMTRRFSAGYGDLPLDIQKEIFRVLDCSGKIGVYLNDSLLMSPSKSVTAFAGLTEGPYREEDRGFSKCTGCGKSDCQYRR